MNPLVYISAGFYFEVSDSEMFGGDETVGYIATNLGGVKDITQITDEYLESQIQGMADFCKVSKEAVKLIAKEDYDRETGEDEELFEDEEDY